MTDVLGYPPHPLRKRWLSHYWKAVFGALGIGHPDYPTFEDFLRNNIDRTYEETKDILLSFASSSVRQELKNISDEKIKLETGSKELLFSELSKTDIGEMAKAHIEELETMVAELRTKLKKRERKQKQKEGVKKPVPILAPVITKIEAEKHGAEYEHAKQRIMSDGKAMLDFYKHDIDTGLLRLTEIEKKELLALIKEKEKETRKEEVRVEIIPAPEKKKEKPEKRIRTATEIFAERERVREREVKREEVEETKEFRPVQLELKHLSTRNATIFLKTYSRQIPDMLWLGMPTWLDKYPQAEKFPLTTDAIRTLAMQLDRARRPLDPLTVHSGREIEAQRFITTQLYVLMTSGIDEAVDSYNWERWYPEYEKDVKDIETFKKDVVNTAWKIAPRIFKI